MSNRWRQGLYNQINQKEEKLEEQREELTQEDLLQVERAYNRLEEIREDLEETPVMSDNLFEEFESRIEEVTTEWE